MAKSGKRKNSAVEIDFFFLPVYGCFSIRNLDGQSLKRHAEWQLLLLLEREWERRGKHSFTSKGSVNMMKLL